MTGHIGSRWVRGPLGEQVGHSTDELADGELLGRMVDRLVGRPSGEHLVSRWVGRRLFQ